MSIVRMDFAPPDEQGMVALVIYEASLSTGPYVQIERTESIGTYPEYINYFTTAQAQSVDDWFAIAWEDAGGALTLMSRGIKVGSKTLVQEVADRVLQRDRDLDANIVIQESEAIIERYLGASDPYAAAMPTFTKLNGLVYLVMARCYLTNLIQSDYVESATLGLVSFRSSRSGSIRTADRVSQLIDMANTALGIQTSMVLQLEDVYNHNAVFQQWFEDWQVQWQQIPWIHGIPHWELP